MSDFKKEHEEKQRYFEELQKTLPLLREELNAKKIELEECQNDIRKQRTISFKCTQLYKELQRAYKNKGNAAILDKYKANVEWMPEGEEEKELVEKYKEWKTLKAQNEVLSKAYKRSMELEKDITKRTMKIVSIENREEEMNYYLENVNLFLEYGQMNRARHFGMSSTMNEEHTTYPGEDRCMYDKPISDDITLNFVTKEGRAMFAATYKVDPGSRPDKIKSLYCLLLRQLCHTEDPVVEEIIKQQGKVTLTEYHLVVPNDSNKSLESVIRYYNIPLKQGNKVDVYIMYPEEELERLDEPAPKKGKSEVAEVRKAKRKELFGRYKDIVDKSLDRCECGFEGHFTVNTKAAEMVCPGCGLVHEQRMIAEGMKGVPYGHQMSSFKTSSDYKPIMHLNDILKQRQGIESTNVPDEVIGAIEEKRKRYRVRVEELDETKIKYWLKLLNGMDHEKKYKFTNYYEHIPQIIVKLGGPEPIRYTREQEKAIRWWFNRLLEPFELFRPKEGIHRRKNLLNYNYLLRQICRLISYYHEDEEEKKFWWEHAETFPLLKDRQKMFVYDKIFSQMMSLLDEPFFPVV